MASIVERRMTDGSKAYLVRFRTPDGHQRSKQFKRKKDADAYVSLVEVDRLQGALMDPRLGRSPSASGGTSGGLRLRISDHVREMLSFSGRMYDQRSVRCRSGSSIGLN